MSSPPTDASLSSEEAAASPAWRERAVERSLERARNRAEEKVQRFLDATEELIDERGGLDFTLQDVVERSDQSLRSFYQFFGGKDHLLLAVAEEGMRASAASLREIVMAVDDPRERLRLFVVTLFEWCEREPLDLPPSPHRSVRSMADFLFELLASEPERAAGATAPLFELCVDVVTGAREANVIRDAPVARSAALVLQTVMFNAFATKIEGNDALHRERADEMWEFCLNGIGRA